MDDHNRRNIEKHSTPDSVAAYGEAVEEGLEDDEAAAILRYFSDTDATVLDIGCGGGRTTHVLRKIGYEVVGFDVSTPMVHEAQSHVSGVPLLIADVTAMGFQAETFEYALFPYNGLDLLYPEQKRHEALREIYRVLKPGGVFIFSARNAWNLPPLEPPFSVRDLGYALLLLAYRLVSNMFANHYRETSIGIRYGDWDEDGVSYFINPFEQKQQLRDHGFKVLDVIGGTFSSNPHYVAWKPLQ